MVSIVVGRPRIETSTNRAEYRRCREMLLDAMAQVSEDPNDCFDLVSLARATNLSPRSVQRHFQAICGLSPQEWFRIERLNRVHEELRDARYGTSVTRIAMRWGFFHLGRFSRYYRQVFGENPVETLRHARPTRSHT